MNERKRRGGWRNPASAENGRKATGGGRPPLKLTIRQGVRVALRDGDTPLEGGTVSEVAHGSVVVTMDDGRLVRLYVG